jgi:hypothetical protein
MKEGAVLGIASKGGSVGHSIQMSLSGEGRRLLLTAVPRESSRLHELEEPFERPAWLVVSFA